MCIHTHIYIYTHIYTISDPPRANYESLTWGSPLFFFLSSFSLFLFFSFFLHELQSNLYASNGGKARNIYNDKATGITGTSVPRRPVVGCNRWRHKPMSTRNLEFLTPSRWLPTTRGSRHLIAPTATGHLSLSLSPFPLRGGWSPFSSSTFAPAAAPSLFLLPLKYTGVHALVRWLFYKLPCVAIGLAGCAHREPRRHPLERAREGEERKKKKRRSGFRDRTTFAPSRRVRTAAARGGRSTRAPDSRRHPTWHVHTEPLLSIYVPPDP